MTRKMIAAALFTVLFFVVVGVFEFLHWRANLEVVEVSPSVTEPLNTTLNVNFIKVLEGREVNGLSPDLVY